MQSFIRILAVTTALVITAHRLPAPIQEIPDRPPSVQEEQANQKKTRSRSKMAEPESKAKASPSANLAQGPARFAGTWTGTITQPTGTGKISLTFNAAATSVTLAGRERPALVTGNTITWRSGMFNGNGWTLAPNSDGKTAQVSLSSGPLGQWSATFSRESPRSSLPKKPRP